MDGTEREIAMVRRYGGTPTAIVGEAWQRF